MLLVAFGFPDVVEANAVQAELSQLLDVEDGDLGLADVGGTPEFIDESAVVLAGRIREQRVDAAVEVVMRHGGEILTDIPEAWAYPSPAKPPEEMR